MRIPKTEKKTSKSVNSLREIALVLVTTVGVIWCTSGSTLADDYETTNYGNKNPSKQEMVESLKPRYNWRSAGLAVGGKPRAISLQVNFELNSFQLMPDAKTKLNELGRAVQDKQLSEFKFSIIGHSDARGEPEYNEALSENRAKAVKRYLIAEFGVDPARLQTKGLGEYDLLDKTNPFSSVNRRVQVVNEGN